MFVRICLNGTSADGVGASVGAAIDAALPEGPSRRFIEVAMSSDIASETRNRDASNMPVVGIMIHAKRYPDRTKRKLFGAILDRLEQDCGIARTAVLIGIVAVPVDNWSAGYSEWQWRELLSYQVP
jgi:hypothetical protein